MTTTFNSKTFWSGLIQKTLDTEFGGQHSDAVGVLASFLVGYDSLRLAVARYVANGVTANASNTQFMNAINAYFAANPYTLDGVEKDGVDKVAYFIGKARRFCANNVTDSTTLQLDMASNLASPTIGSDFSDYYMATNILTSVSAGANSVLDWLVESLTGQRAVDFFIQGIDAAVPPPPPATASLGLSAPVSMPTVISSVLAGPFVATYNNGNFTVSSGTNSTPNFRYQLSDGVSVPQSITVSYQDVWLSSTFGTITNNATTYFLCPSAWVVDVLYSNGAHYYCGIWYGVGVYLQNNTNLTTTTTSATFPTTLSASPSSQQAILALPGGPTTYTNAYIQVAFQSVTSNVPATFIAQYNGLGFTVSSGTQSTPIFLSTLADGVSVVLSISVSAQDMWLAGAFGTVTNSATTYFLCPSAWVVDVLYSNGMHSYSGIWYGVGVYLQNNTNLTTPPSTTIPIATFPASLNASSSSAQAIVSLPGAPATYTNAYIQANSQQFWSVVTTNLKNTFTLANGTAAGMFALANGTHQTPDFSVTYLNCAITSITVTVDDIWLTGMNSVNTASVYYFCPNCWIVDVQYANGYHSYLAYYLTVSFYLQGRAFMSNPIPTALYPASPVPLTVPANNAQMAFQLLTPTTAAVANAYIQANSQQYASPWPSSPPTNTVGGVFSLGAGSVPGTYMLWNGTTEQTPNIAGVYLSFGITAITVSAQDVWLNGSAGGSTYFLCSGAWVVDVQYANGYHSYFAYWYASSFYLQGRTSLAPPTVNASFPTSLHASSSSAQAVLSSTPTTATYNNAYVQASAQQYATPWPSSSPTNNVGGVFTLGVGSAPGTYTLWNGPSQKTPDFSGLCLAGGIASINVSSQNVWLAGGFGTIVANSASNYFLCPGMWVVDVQYANGYHSYLGFWYGTSVYLQGHASLTASTANVPYPTTLQPSSSTAQARLTLPPSPPTTPTTAYTYAYVQTNSQQYEVPWPVPTNNVGATFTLAAGSVPGTFTLWDGTSEQLPNFAAKYLNSWITAITVSAQPFWLIASTSTKGIVTYAPTNPAHFVDVMYSNGYHSYFGYWYSATGFYLQNNAILTTSANATLATLATSYPNANAPNQYIQVASQQFNIPARNVLIKNSSASRTIATNSAYPTPPLASQMTTTPGIRTYTALPNPLAPSSSITVSVYCDPTSTPGYFLDFNSRSFPYTRNNTVGVLLCAPAVILGVTVQTYFYFPTTTLNTSNAADSLTYYLTSIVMTDSVNTTNVLFTGTYNAVDPTGAFHNSVIITNAESVGTDGTMIAANGLQWDALYGTPTSTPSQYFSAANASAPFPMFPTPSTGFQNFTAQIGLVTSNYPYNNFAHVTSTSYAPWGYNSDGTFSYQYGGVPQSEGYVDFLAINIRGPDNKTIIPMCPGIGSSTNTSPLDVPNIGSPNIPGEMHIVAGLPQPVLTNTCSFAPLYAPTYAPVYADQFGVALSVQPNPVCLLGHNVVTISSGTSTYTSYFGAVQIAPYYSQCPMFLTQGPLLTLQGGDFSWQDILTLPPVGVYGSCEMRATFATFTPY